MGANLPGTFPASPYEPYEWHRFLVPRGVEPDLSDNGFLRAPGDWFAASHAVAPIPPADVAVQRCVVILGEHGIGKSDIMRRLADDAAQQPDSDTVCVDLSTIGSDSRFESRVARNPEVAAWLMGDHRLHLFFDSLDEGLLRVDQLAGLLREWLSELGPHRHRLSLRLACRTGDWPGESFENSLRVLWPDDGCGIYEVAPLQRTDVITAAEAEGVDPYAFLGEVLRVDAVSLAIRPLTLRLILNTFKRGDGHLPEARRDVYLQGITELCTERGQGRRESGRTGQYTQRQRMAVAARIAYVMAFAGLSAIRTVPPLGDLQDGEVAQDDLVGGSEAADDGTSVFAVTNEAMAETLGTGLFTSRGPDRLGWAHRDYRDFLAAWYVSRSAIGADQCMALLQHPDDPRGAIAPQLRAVAAWLAEADTEVFRRVLDCDYAALLDADAAPLAAQDRAAFAAALLSVPDKTQLVRRAYVAGSLPNLSHPGLAAQLRAALANADPDTGRLAIAIARDSGEGTILSAEVADVALDRGRPLGLRTSAAYAIAKSDDDAAHTRLRPLALEPDPLDVQDELKGNALRDCWPAHLTVADLFGALTRPRVGNFLGAYKGFLSTDILRDVPDTDLPISLDWITREAGDYFLDRIADGILWRALPHLERADMARAFALAFLARVHRRHQLMREHRDEERFAAALRDSVAGRRQLIEALLPILHTWDDEPGRLVYLRPRLVFADDLPWIIERAQRAGAATQPLWIALLGDLSRFFDVDGWSALYEACEAVPAIDAAFHEVFAPVDINSPHAEELRAEHARGEALQARLEAMRQEPPPPPALAARLAPLLDRSKAGESEAWIAVCRELVRDSNGRLPAGYPFVIDLTSRPGWAEIEDAMQRRIVAAAERYIATWTPAPARWLARSRLRESDIADDWAGLQAIVLIHDVEPARILNCAGEIWRGWAPVLAGFPYLTDAYPADAVRLLIAEAYRHAPDAVLDTVGVRIRHEAEQSGYITVLSLLADCWDDRLTTPVLDIAASRELSPEATGQILGVLLDHGAAAIPFLESLVDAPVPTDTRERRFAVVAATLMIRRVPGAWPRVWAAISADAAFGRDLVEEMVRTDRWTAGSVRGLAPDAVADLYLWLIAQYPLREDPADDDDGELFQEITVREDIATWRDSIPGLIEERATPDALAALRRVSGALPHIRWLRIVAAETEDAVRRATWRPRFTARQLLRLAQDSRSRIVQNGDHLMAIIEESLHRLERDILHGATPQVGLLWNEIGNGISRPKDELTLSDYVKIHLEREMPEVVVNREVEIHLGHDRLDILVDALPVPPASERISAVLEVKGGWNREWRTAMKTQLSDRYLVNGPYRCGLYLVGWYMCDQWDRNDMPRFRNHPKEGGIVAMRAQLEEKATALTSEGRRVRAMVLNLSLGPYSTRRRGPSRSQLAE